MHIRKRFLVVKIKNEGIKMKKIYITGALALMLLSAPISVYAATGYQTYTDYTLYANCYNNATAKHNKETNDQYMSNKVTSYTNTDKATFWATDGNSSRISKTYNIGVQGSAKMTLTTKKTKGAVVRMGMENYHNVQTYAKASGRVDFR